MSGNGAGPARHSDVIVIGAGHNGLVAACYLAKAGLDTLVLEASPGVGGMISTNPIVDGAPNHMINEGGIQASLFRATTIEADLDLRRRGFRQINADPYHVHLDRDSGASIAIWKDPRRTADEIRHFSRKDADAWLEMSRTLAVAMDIVTPFMLTHPTRPSAGAVARILTGAARGHRRLLDLARMFSTSHSETIAERFEHPLVKGALAQMPAGFSWMAADMTGWALVYLGVCHRTGSTRFAGGTGSLTDALHSALLEYGGAVRTSAKVEDLLLQGGRIAGVRLEGGEELSAGTVMASCNPHTTLNDMLPEGTLEERLASRARWIPITATQSASLKIDVACSGRLDLPRHNAWRKDGLDLREPVCSWQTFEEHEEAWTASIGGRWPKAIPFIGIVPTALDPSQAPDGQDTFWMWSGIIPNFPLEGWESVRDQVGQQIVDECSLVYEGLDRLEIGRSVRSAPELATRFHVPGGNVYHVSATAMRFGPLRPAVGLGSYKMPVPGLWITGAGTHPTGGISGIPGFVAAKALLKHLFKEGLPRVSHASTHAARVPASGRAS